jgi:hypothetical protein
MNAKNNDNNLYCSPYNQTKYGEKDGTCYSLTHLKAIAQEYNKLTNTEKINIKQPKKKLHNDLEKAFQSICNDELCWAHNNLITNYELKKSVKNSFRPMKPIEWYDDRKTWLNTYDILFVMKQYEKLYKHFKFIGVFPIDFAEKDESNYCIGDDLCNFNINSLIDQKKKIFGFIINLDKHNEPGSHWVSLFCNLNPKKENYGIYYYDSVANTTPKEISDFMNLVKSQVNNKNFEVKNNKIQKQFANSECGTYSIIFATQMLKDVPFDFICKNMRTDAEINKLRDVIYHPSKKL